MTLAIDDGAEGQKTQTLSKVDRLPPELKDTVEQMLLTGRTYKEIVAFLKENGEEMSQMAICTYAKKYLATVEMINVAQSNFSMLMDEMNRYPDLDTSEALIRLASHHVLNALTNVDEEQMKEMPIDKLIRQTNALIRAGAYKNVLTYSPEKIMRQVWKLLRVLCSKQWQRKIQNCTVRLVCT
ncbi:MAG: phage protein Gp27 family protein [Roseburia inulinivorans]